MNAKRLEKIGNKITVLSESITVELPEVKMDKRVQRRYGLDSVPSSIDDGRGTACIQSQDNQCLSTEGALPQETQGDT